MSQVSHPTRSCAGCRAKRPASALVRLNVDAGKVAAARRIRGSSEHGRGLYTCPKLACADRTLRRLVGRKNVGAQSAVTLLSEASRTTDALLAKRRDGLRRRGLVGDDVRTIELTGLSVSLREAVASVGVGA